MNVTTSDSVQIISSTYQKVILNAPYIFLWSFSALEYYYVKKNKTNSIPWGILNTSKLICNLLCFCVTSLNLITIFLGFTLISKTVIFTLIQLLTFVSFNHRLQTDVLPTYRNSPYVWSETSFCNLCSNTDFFQ